MEPKRFISNSLSKLHARVRKELGEDAVILSTRSLHRDGAPPLIEMMATLPEAEPAVSLEFQHTVIEATLKRAEFSGRLSVAEFDALVNLGADAAPMEADFTPAPHPATPAGPAFQPDPPEWVEGFVENAPAAPVVYEMPSSPASVIREQPVQASLPPLPMQEQIHPYRFGTELLDAGLSRRAVDRVASYAPDALSASSALAHALAQPVRYPADGRTAVVTLQGPAGSGRTTALMRMALDCAESGRETILVAADSTRAAARDQVHFYAEVLGLQSLDAYSDADLEMVASRANLGACLFVDVPPGAWRRPAALLVEHFAYRALPSHWESGAACGDLEGLPGGTYSGCVPTFTDLASGMSPVLSLALEAGFGLAFLSSSRDVSTGIGLADPNTLASGVLLKPTRETSDGRLGAIA